MKITITFIRFFSGYSDLNGNLVKHKETLNDSFRLIFVTYDQHTVLFGNSSLLFLKQEPLGRQINYRLRSIDTLRYWENMSENGIRKPWFHHISFDTIKEAT